MRYVRLERYLSEILATYDVDAIGYELVRRHMGTDASHIYGGIIAHLKRLAEEHMIPYRGIPVGTVKRLFCGKGNAGKAAMILAAQSRYGISGDLASDEADALAVAFALAVELC